MSPVVLGVIVLAAFSSWFVVLILLPIFQRSVLDYPNSRSSHRTPTPRGGGLAFIVVAVVGSLLALSWAHWGPGNLLALYATPLAAVGFLDDRYSLSPVIRYGFQFLTALLLLSFSVLPFSYFPYGLILLVAVTAVINFTNFMDGLDGLVAGCMSVAIGTLAITLASPWPIWVVFGSLLGFLLWNWSPAKVFMGDAGSTFLGAVFAGLVLHAPTWPEALGLLLVATPLLGDACLCVPRRLLAGQRVFQAHRLHLFQRLHQAGWPHARVSSLYIAGTALLAAALLAGGWTWVVGLAVVELFVGFWLDRHVAVPFTVASQS